MKIDFAEEFPEHEFTAEFKERFAERVLGMEWEEIVFVSTSSDLLDFDICCPDADEMKGRIWREYGIEVQTTNLLDVMRLCAAHPPLPSTNDGR